MEIVVYIAIFGIMMSGVVGAVYGLLEGGDRNKMAVAIQEEGTFLNRKINWALTGGTAVTVSGGTILTITRPDLGLQSPLVITVSGNNMTLARGAAIAQKLNSTRFAITAPVSGPVFTYAPAAGGKPPSVTASFLVKDTPFIFRQYLRQ